MGQNLTALSIKNLNKKWKNSDFELQNISIDLPKGTILGLVGRNGAGKTTTISCVLGLLAKDEGIITIFGQNIDKRLESINDEIGVVLDADVFSQVLSAKKINKIMKHIYKNWDERLFFDYIEKFKLPIDNTIKTYSAGMKKKLAFSVAISHNPKLLILDELSSGLDPVSRDELLEMLLEFIQDENKAILLSSHITTDLEKIADYVVFICDGKVLLFEAKDTLLYEYGIIRCSHDQYIQIDEYDIISSIRNENSIHALARNIRDLKLKYPNIIINKPSIDEILLILQGEKK